MVTAGTSFGGRARTATNLPGRRYDHLFFSGMALLSLATVFVVLPAHTILPDCSMRLCITGLFTCTA